MTRSVTDYLKDIQAEINFLLNQTKGNNFETFADDAVLTRAAVRSLEIIGEAVKNIPIEIRNAFPIIGWKDIACMRDK